MNMLPVICGTYETLSPSERRIADVVLQKPAEVAEMTITQLAALASVSQGTVINFCTHLGLKGFTDLKLHLARHSVSDQGFPFAGMMYGDGPLVALEAVQRSIKTGLEMTYAIQSDRLLAAAAQAIEEARHIELYAAGDSLSVAQHFQNSLLRIGIRSSVVADPMLAALSAGQLPEGTLAVGISHSGRTRSTLRSLTLAKEHGAQILALSSFPQTPIQSLADFPLLIRCAESDHHREAFLSSLLHMFLLDSLCTYLAAKKRSSSLPITDELSALFEEYR